MHYWIADKTCTPNCRAVKKDNFANEQKGTPFHLHKEKRSKLWEKSCNVMIRYEAFFQIKKKKKVTFPLSVDSNFKNQKDILH